MTARAVTLVVAAFVGCWFCQGCASTVREPTRGVEAKYQWDVLEARVDRSIWEVHEAAQEAVEDLELRVIYKGVDGLAGAIRAVDARFENVDVQLGALPRSRTLLTIQIGLFGDKDKSIVLFEHIMAQLGDEPSPTAGRPRDEPADSADEL